MRTPSNIYESTMAQQNDHIMSNDRHYPSLINRNYKRKSFDHDLSTQAKIARKNQIDQIFFEALSQTDTSPSAPTTTEYMNENINSISGSNNNNNLQSSTIEYIFDSHLLPVQNHVISEADTLNINDLNQSWNNAAEILDLDHNKNGGSEINNDFSVNSSGQFSNGVCNSGQHNYNEISKFTKVNSAIKPNQEINIGNNKMCLTRKFILNFITFKIS